MKGNCELKVYLSGLGQATAFKKFGLTFESTDDSSPDLGSRIIACYTDTMGLGCEILTAHGDDLRAAGYEYWAYLPRLFV